MRQQVRTPYEQFLDQVKSGLFVTPNLLHWGGPLAIDAALNLLGAYGHHGALDPVEGAVWQVERQQRLCGDIWWEVDFLVKFVRPAKLNGC